MDSQKGTQSDTVKKIEASRMLIQGSLEEMRQTSQASFERMFDRLKVSDNTTPKRKGRRRSGKRGSARKFRSKKGTVGKKKTSTVEKTSTRKTPRKMTRKAKTPRTSGRTKRKTRKTPRKKKMGAKKKVVPPKTPESDEENKSIEETLSPNSLKRYTTKFAQDVEQKKISDVPVIMGFESISVPSYNITSLEGLGVRKRMKTLYLQNNYLNSFKYLNSQPDMVELVVNHNCITSLLGMEKQPKLKKVSMIGNPITKHEHYRIMILVAAGTQIKEIDGVTVDAKEKNFAKQYMQLNPYAVTAIRNGWLLDKEARGKEDFREIFMQLGRLDLDDRSVLKNSTEYRRLIRDYSTGGWVKTTRKGAKNELFEEKEDGEDGEIEMSKLTKTNLSEIVMEQEKKIKKLQAHMQLLETKSQSERDDFNRIKETCLTFDDLALFDTILIRGFSMYYDEQILSVNLILHPDYFKIITVQNEVLSQVFYYKIGKTSLLMDFNKVFRFNIQHDKDEYNLLTKNNRMALSLYKILHLLIARGTKKKNELLRKMIQEGKEPEEEVIEREEGFANMETIHTKLDEVLSKLGSKDAPESGEFLLVGEKVVDENTEEDDDEIKNEKKDHILEESQKIREDFEMKMEMEAQQREMEEEIDESEEDKDPKILALENLELERIRKIEEEGGNI